MGDAATDYYHIEPDPAKDPPEYSTNERRAEVLDFILSSGSPKSVSRVQLAERYDCAPSTITRDIARLGESLGEMFDENTVILETRALREQVVNDLLQEDDWRAKKAALDAQYDWVDFLGYADVMVEDAEEDETVTSGDPEHRISETTRKQLDRLQQQAERELEEKGLVVDTTGDGTRTANGGEQ